MTAIAKWLKPTKVGTKARLKKSCLAAAASVVDPRVMSPKDLS